MIGLSSLAIIFSILILVTDARFENLNKVPDFNHANGHGNIQAFFNSFQTNKIFANENSKYGGSRKDIFDKDLNVDFNTFNDSDTSSNNTMIDDYKVLRNVIGHFLNKTKLILKTNKTEDQNDEIQLSDTMEATQLSFFQNVTQLNYTSEVTFNYDVTHLSKSHDYDVTEQSQTDDVSGGKILSRQKRNFGGREPIDYPKAVNATFLVAGWVTQGCEAFNDIQFHLLGYTVLGNDLTV